jgi:AmmeMemoRadiSam system protein A
MKGVDALELSLEEKVKLKACAREAIEAVLLGQKTTVREFPERLKQKTGAFVCLKKKGELRGCIGYLHPAYPLSEAVEKAAVQSAFHDPRFGPLERDEWEDIDVEISVLSPMRQITDIEEVQVGTHGLYIEQGTHSGLLLPQVATENGWDRITFLEYTCYKAGLPKDAYKSKNTVIYVFSAVVF